MRIANIWALVNYPHCDRSCLEQIKEKPVQGVTEDISHETKPKGFKL